MVPWCLPDIASSPRGPRSHRRSLLPSLAAATVWPSGATATICAPTPFSPGSVTNLYAATSHKHTGDEYIPTAQVSSMQYEWHNNERTPDQGPVVMMQVILLP